MTSRIHISCVLLLTVACGGDDGDDDGGITSDFGDDGAMTSADDGATAPADGAMDATGGGGDFLGSCDTRTMGNDIVLGQCRDWYGSPGADLQVSCDGIGGTFSESMPCPTTDRIGTCTLAPVLDISAVYNFYAPTTVDEAMQTCEGLSGTFAE